jgi:iron complex transport system ATP-binding protein
MPSLAAKSLFFSYGDREVLRDVTFDADHSEIIGILGPNGCGKTTLLRALGGFINFQGTVSYGDKDLGELSERQRAEYRSYVPQGLHAEIPHDVHTMISMGLAHQHPLYLNPKGLDEKVESVIVRLEIGIEQTRTYVSLSGGEQQLVLLARALVQDSPLILLDEPTSALDLRHQTTTCRELQARKKKGATILVVMHDINLASRICDRVLLMQHGSIVEQGEPKEVLRRDLLNSVFETNLAVASGTDNHPRVELVL